MRKGVWCEIFVNCKSSLHENWSFLVILDHFNREKQCKQQLMYQLMYQFYSDSFSNGASAAVSNN